MHVIDPIMNCEWFIHVYVIYRLIDFKKQNVITQFSSETTDISLSGDRLQSFNPLKPQPFLNNWKESSPVYSTFFFLHTLRCTSQSYISNLSNKWEIQVGLHSKCGNPHLPTIQPISLKFKLFSAQICNL